jgi:hypothetical protein
MRQATTVAGRPGSDIAQSVHKEIDNGDARSGRRLYLQTGLLRVLEVSLARTSRLDLQRNPTTQDTGIHEVIDESNREPS